MWIPGKNSPSDTPLVDWNAQFRATLLKDAELDEDLARRTLGQFLRHNIGILIEVLTRKMLEPYQRIVLKGWLTKNRALCVAGRSFGKCIDRNALVLTETGFKRMHEVGVGERIWANQALQTVQARVDNPREAGLVITTDRGHECTGKMGHKVYTLDTKTLDFEWRDIETLDGSETIPIRYGMQQWGNATPLADYVPAARPSYCNELQPLTEDPNLYYLMGVILGDGYIKSPNAGAMGISTADPEIVTALQTVIDRYMPDTSVSCNRKQDNKASDYRFSNARFKDLLFYMGFNREKAHAKAFPQRMLSVERASMTAFLRGLFDTDGHCCASNHGNGTNIGHVGFCSSSRDIVKTVHSILLNLGIVSKVRLKHKGGWHRFSNGKEYLTHDAWDLLIADRASMEAFARQIGFSIKRKQAKLEAYLATPLKSEYKHNMVNVSAYLVGKYGRRAFRDQGLRLRKDLSVARLREIASFPFVDAADRLKITAITEAGCYYDYIESITPTETETIDIQVDQEECYWSDGFISHNSTIGSHFAYLYCLLNPGHHILICAATFRSSRQIVERVDEWARSRDGVLLAETIQPLPNKGMMTKRQDLVRITFKNGSSITAVPLGDPDNLRGFRCNVLMIDEGLLISRHTIEMVLKPFLAGGADSTKRQRIRRKEKRAIEAGKMDIKDKVVFKADSKMIILSSASYKWEELYDTYKEYRAIIERNDENVKADQTDKGVCSYLVQQLSYEVVNPDLMDAGILEEIKQKRMPQSTIDREYKARFIDESGGFFSAKQMQDATFKDGESPCSEIVGEKGAEYVLGIDPAGGSIGADPAGDHFAMCVLKIVTRKDERKIGVVVHQYACAGVDLEHHIAYLNFILQRFNIVYVVVDSTGGENVDFVNICNESRCFAANKMKLTAIQAEFAKEDWEETIKAVKKSYNPDSSLRRIVQRQYFSSSIIKAGNDNLRACFEQKTIMFASRIQAIPNKTAMLCSSDVMRINETHPAFHDKAEEGSSMWEYVINQDALMNQTKKECALIEVTSSPLGHLTFDLPHHMTRNRKNVLRNRKDSYSALWLAAWGLKIYLASQEYVVETEEEFTPVMVGLSVGG